MKSSYRLILVSGYNSMMVKQTHNNHRHAKYSQVHSSYQLGELELVGLRYRGMAVIQLIREISCLGHGPMWPPLANFATSKKPPMCPVNLLVDWYFYSGCNVKDCLLLTNHGLKHDGGWQWFFYGMWVSPVMQKNSRTGIVDHLQWYDYGMAEYDCWDRYIVK